MGLIFRPKVIALVCWFLLLRGPFGILSGIAMGQMLPSPQGLPSSQPVPMAPFNLPGQPSVAPVNNGVINPAPGADLSQFANAPVTSVLPNWPLNSLLPAKVRAYIHYSIQADNLGRVVLYRHFISALNKAGFERDGEDDPDPTEPQNSKHVLISGNLPSASLDQVANLSAIRSILITPIDFDLAKAGENPVRVEMMLGRGSTRVLLDTSPPTHKALDSMGFKESVIYDTYKGTRLLGSLPGSQLLKVGQVLGLPFGSRLGKTPFQPVLVVWAGAGGSLPTPVSPAPEAPAGFTKVAPELRKPLAEAGKIFRVELLFDRPFPSQASAIEALGKLSPNLVFEALLGSAVTVVGSSEDLRAVANDPQINGIRPGPVAHAGSFSEKTTKEGGLWTPMRNSPLSPPTRVAIGGKVLRETVAIIDDDYRGAESLPGWKEGKLRSLDLTRERDQQLLPDSFPGPVNEMGRGTQFAKSLIATQPDVRLILIRIDRSVPAMIQRVAKAIQGENVLADELMAQRLNEIRNDRIALAEERGLLEKDWKENGDDFAEEPEALRKRIEYQKKMAVIRQGETRHHQRLERYLSHQKVLQDLKEVRLVLCPLVWNEGLPRGGASTLSRWFDDRPFRSALWVQSAGDRQGQTWAGIFRDSDKNGVMEWTALEPGQDPFPAEEMSILWKPGGAGSVQGELPAGTRIRVTLQWREPRDPYQSQVDRESSRAPIADLKIRLVRLEPVPGKGEKRLAERVTVAQPVGPALLIDHTDQSAVFECFTDLEIQQTGRYEARIEGKIPDSIIPQSSPQLPVNRIKPEIHPVIWLRTLSPGGAAVWPQAGDKPVVGVPGDAQQVLSVSSAAGMGQFPLVWDPSNLIERSDLKPDLIVDGEGKNASDAVFGAAAAILPIIHPDQDVRYWKRTPALPAGLTRSVQSQPVPR